jgi:hypothetical protein
LTLDVEEGMENSAILLFLLGFAVGTQFRLRILLMVVALLAPVSIVLALAQGFSALAAATIAMAAQTIVQASYFLGLVARAAFGKV